MRISLVGPVYPYRGGIAHYTAQLARALGDAEHAVQMISFKRQYPAWLYPGASDLDPSKNALQVDAQYLLDPLYPWTWVQAARLLKQHTPDLVVIQWWTTFWSPAYAWLAAALRREAIAVVYIIHNVIPHEPRFFDRALAKLALNRGSAFLAQTIPEAERLLALLPGRRVEICPHPVSMVFAGQGMPKAVARERLGLEVQTPVLLFFGIVRAYKGLQILIEALTQLREQDQNPVLVVAGEIWEDKEIYRRLIHRHGLEQRIRLEDRYIPDEEAAIMFSAADMLVAPYMGGTQSGAAGMALGFGLPMVVSDVVSAGIALENLKYVQVFPAGDVQALVEAIRRGLRQTADEPKVERAENDWWRLVRTLEALVERG